MGGAGASVQLRNHKLRQEQLARLRTGGPLCLLAIALERTCMARSLIYTAVVSLSILSLSPIAVSQARQDSRTPENMPTPEELKNPPKTWIDKDTGHRVTRLTDEPGSASFYFNVNGYTPDGTEMVYTTPDGISVLNLKTHA